MNDCFDWTWRALHFSSLVRSSLGCITVRKASTLGRAFSAVEHDVRNHDALYDVSSGFYCNPTYCTIYLWMTVGIMVLGVLVAWHGAKESAEAFWIRVLGFVSLGLLSLIPSTRKIMCNGI